MKAYKDMTESERKKCAKRINMFVLAAHNACTKKDTVFDFKCPICHGIAQAFRSGYNGHYQASCTSCDLSFFE